MKPPIIDFSQTATSWWLGHGTGMKARVLALAALAAATGLLVWQLRDWSDKHQALLQEAERLQSLQRKAALLVPPARRPEVALSPREVARHNLAAGQLNSPWSDIFDGLERTAQNDVGLTLLEPDTKRGTLRVQAEAKKIDSLLAYAQLVAADSAFSGLALLQHETNEQDANRPSRLSFDVKISSGLNGSSKP